MTSLLLPLLLAFASPSALAAAPASIDARRYPRRATVLVPEGAAGDVVRVVVPAELRSARDPVDASDLALLDARGQPLAMTVARGQSDIDTLPLQVTPTDDGDTWLIEDHGRPLDGLQIDLRGREWVARAAVDRWDGGRWVEVAAPSLVWEHDQGRDTRVPLPGVSGPLRLRLSRLHDSLRHRPRVDGVLWTAPSADPVELTLPIAQAVLQENGWSRYTVELPRPLPIQAVRIDATDPVFEREVDVALIGELDAYHQPQVDGTIRRIRLGGAALDQVTLSVQDQPADMLVLWIQSDGLVPLDLAEVTVLLEGAELLVPAPGPGPLTLLAGADPNTTPTGDLDIALPELSRMASLTLSPEPAEDNPDWTPPEVRAGLAGPSTPLAMAGMSWSHPVQGGPGLVRIPLTLEVLADTRRGMDDLRLVDVEGRQIPYLLRRRPVDLELGELSFTRTEEGSQSRLSVPLPTAGRYGDGPPLATVRLTTDAPLFRRSVVLNRLRGATLEPLRGYHWVGEDRPATLSFDVDRPVGQELVLTIDNGDDPPLPIDSVLASVQSWELVAHLPAGGARLVYGDPDRPSPDYDLGLLRSELVARAGAVATLGPRESLEPAPATAVEKGLVFTGLAALVGGLSLLILGLVRAVPDEDAPAPPGEQ